MKNAVKFRTQHNPEYKGSPFVHEYPKSETVPDMNMSVQEIMQNHTRGLGIGTNPKEEVYMEDLEVPRPTDLTDIEESRNRVKEQAEEVKKKIASDQEAAKKAKEAAQNPPDPKPSKEDPPKEE